ncbi:hypothetical protein RCL1_003287 [Eukaryota sp. TZLM3-RCL]
MPSTITVFVTICILLSLTTHCQLASESKQTHQLFDESISLKSNGTETNTTDPLPPITTDPIPPGSNSTDPGDNDPVPWTPPDDDDDDDEDPIPWTPGDDDDEDPIPWTPGDDDDEDPVPWNPNPDENDPIPVPDESGCGPCLAGFCSSNQTCVCHHGFSGSSCDSITVNNGRIGFSLPEKNIKSIATVDPNVTGTPITLEMRNKLKQIGIDLFTAVFGRDDILLGVTPRTFTPACSSRAPDGFAIGTGLLPENIGIGVYDVILRLQNTSTSMLMVSKVEATVIGHRGNVRVRQKSVEGEWETLDVWAGFEVDCSNTGSQVSVAYIQALPTPGSRGIAELHFSTRERAIFVITDLFFEAYVEPLPYMPPILDDQNPNNPNNPSGPGRNNTTPNRDSQTVTSGSSRPKLGILMAFLVAVIVKVMIS